jgi:hypothetical protein
MSTFEREVRGLVVDRHGRSYSVTHAGSGLPATPPLRQRRFAEEARTELLATGTDFTADRRAVSDSRAQWREVYQRWQVRARQGSYDDTTFEYYSPHASYGTFVPSAAWAQAMRDAVAAGDVEAIKALLRTQKGR